MTPERRLELLAYASECFSHNTNPFDITHLVKKQVTADECLDLSDAISSVLLYDVVLHAEKRDLSEILRTAEKEYNETRE